MRTRNFAAAAALSLGTVAMTATASTAHAAPVITGGLVNVTVTDVIDDVTVVVQDVNVGVAAALNIAANVCDVNVNVLARQLKGGEATCTNATDGLTATITQICHADLSGRGGNDASVALIRPASRSRGGALRVRRHSATTGPTPSPWSAPSGGDAGN